MGWTASGGPIFQAGFIIVAGRASAALPSLSFLPSRLGVAGRRDRAKPTGALA